MLIGARSTYICPSCNRDDHLRWYILNVKVNAARILLWSEIDACLAYPWNQKITAGNKQHVCCLVNFYLVQLFVLLHMLCDLSCIYVKVTH
jgi:hypothetical protein